MRLSKDAVDLVFSLLNNANILNIRTACSFHLVRCLLYFHNNSVYIVMFQFKDARTIHVQLLNNHLGFNIAFCRTSVYMASKQKNSKYVNQLINCSADARNVILGVFFLELTIIRHRPKQNTSSFIFILCEPDCKRKGEYNRTKAITNVSCYL